MHCTVHVKGYRDLLVCIPQEEGVGDPRDTRLFRIICRMYYRENDDDVCQRQVPNEAVAPVVRLY